MRVTRSKHPAAGKSSASTAAQKVTVSSERRSTESADQAQLSDISISRADSQLTREFLFALNRSCQPQDEWFIVPTKKMDTTKFKDYQSERLLSKMIDVDGAFFAEALFRDKPRKMKKEAFLSEKYGVEAKLHRDNVLYINFRSGASLRLGDSHLSVPDFCKEAIESTTKALVSVEYSNSREAVCDFIESLKKGSNDLRWHLRSPFHHILADVLHFNDDDIAAAASSVGASHATTTTTNIPEEGVSIPLPIVSPTTEGFGKRGEEKSTFFSPSGICTSCTHGLYDVPIVSPTGEGSVEEGEERTVDQVFSPAQDNSSVVEDDLVVASSGEYNATPLKPLLSMLKKIHPRKSKQTIDNLNSGMELQWKEKVKCKRFTRKDAVKTSSLEVNALLHSASNQDPERAAQIVRNVLESSPLLHDACLAELENASNKEKNSSSDVDASIVNNINTFHNDLHSNGTRRKSDQEAINSVHSAAVYKANVSQVDDIRKRLHIPKGSIKRARTRVRRSVTDSKLHYNHDKRKTRKDNKRKKSLKYVRDFCHNNGWDRSTKVDTGEYRIINTKDENGTALKCMLRRWEDLATRKDVYDKWNRSEQAKKFAKECKLGPISSRIFWENVCPCCRFSIKDMCSDQISTGLEEARAAMERALKDKVLSKAAFLCQCPYHQNERERNQALHNESEANGHEHTFVGGSSDSDDDSCDSSDCDDDSCDEDVIDYCKAYSASQLGVFLRQQGEAIIKQSCCPEKSYPKLERHADVESKRRIPEFINLDCVLQKCEECGIALCFGGQDITQCPVFFPPDNIDEDVTQRRFYKVKIWEPVMIDRTDRTQKELVTKRMAIGDLVQHFLDCISAARIHYAMYKFVGWNHELFKYNTEPSHKRIVMYSDFSANPNLTAARTSTGAADTHAVLAIFISFQYTYDDDGNVVCTKKSHHFIGSSESAGKKNNWMFHNACLEYLIDKLKIDQPGVEEVTVITDRSSGQYLCRQNFLQMAKYSSKAGNPVIRHLFAVVHRFKGDHDAEGKVAKELCLKRVLAGEDGSKAWSFYVTCKSNSKLCPKAGEAGQKMNKLKERNFHYVSYNKTDFDSRNRDEHEGDIVLANMNNTDDAIPLDRTKEIYMIAGIGAHGTALTQDAIQERQVDVWGILDGLEMKETDTENNAQFLDRIKREEGLTLSLAEMARHDCILIGMGDIDACALLTELAGMPRDYITEFCYRAGKLIPPKGTKAMVGHIRKWLIANDTDRLHILRSKEQITNLYNKVFPNPPDAGMTIKNMMGDIMGQDLRGPDDAEDGEYYWLRRSNLPCGCSACLSGQPEDCVSPFKKYMKTREVKIRKLPV